MKFGVQLGISNKILIGNINKKGTMFLSKEDKTIQVLGAVKELIEDNDENNLTTELADDEFRYIFSVEKIKKDKQCQ